MYDPEGTWKRRGIITAVLALVLLIGAGIGVLVASGQDDTPPEADKATTGSSGPDENSSSVCGLPDGAQDVPSIGPDAEWEPIDDLLTPITDEFGPGKQSAGAVHSCFARNPTGALIALAVYFADRNNADADQLELARTRYMPTGGFEENVERHESGDANADPAGTVGQIAGFRFYEYSPDGAQIELAFRLTGSETNSGLLGFTVDLEWRSGDWLVLLPEGLDFTVTQPRELTGRVIWSATPSGTAGGEDLSSSRPGRSLFFAPGTGAQAIAPGLPATAEKSTPVQAGEVNNGTDCDGLLSCAGVGLSAVSPGLGAAAGAAGDLAGDAAGAAASGVASNALEEIAASAQEAAEWAIEELLTAWLIYPDPNVSAADSVTVWLQANLSGLVVFAMVFSVIAASIRLVVTQRFEHVRELGLNLVRVLLVAGLTTVLVGLGLEVGDLVAEYLLSQADVELGAGAAGLVGFTGLTNPILVILVALVVLATQILQLALMVIRGAVVTLLAGALPLMAATAGTGPGKQAYQKAIAWLVAFVLYKPVAALIYATAIRMTNGDQDVATQISGLGLMVLAIIALPALMRLVVSATGALGATSGGGLAMAGMGAAVATGAMFATGGTAATAGAASGAATNSAPIGGAGGPSGGAVGGTVAGSGVGPEGSSAGGPTVDPPGKSGLQPVGQPAGVGTAGEDGTLAPRHEASGGSSGAGTPAPGATQGPGGETQHGVGGAAAGAARGARAGGVASRAAGGVVGPGSGAEPDGDDDQGGTP